MLPIFKLGAGGKIGSGRQYWSWVVVDDVVGAILHALEEDSLKGPINVTVNRPTVFPLPAPAARVMLGQVADELLLASQRIEPARLKETGYSYRYPELEGALRYLLGR